MDTVALVLGISHSTVFTEFALSIGTKWFAGPLRIKVTFIAGFKPSPWREACRLLTQVTIVQDRANDVLDHKVNLLAELL
jgi:hypothetical protein